MPGERLSMRKIREVLRLRFAQGLSQRAIGISLRLSTGAVNACLSRARLAGLSWPLPEALDDSQLEALLCRRRLRWRQSNDRFRTGPLYIASCGGRT